MRRKILMGAIALALPLATTVGLASAAGAKPAPNPVTCNFSATVTFSTPLSVKGVLSSKGATSQTTINGTYSSCTTASGPVAGMSQSVTINGLASKPNKDPAALAAGDDKKMYYLGLCGSFTSTTTTKALGKGLKNLPVAGGILKGPKAVQGVVGPDVGFIVTATVKGGTYPTASKGASIMTGLLNDANNTNIVGGCTGGPANHLDVDASVSTAVL